MKSGNIKDDDAKMNSEHEGKFGRSKTGKGKKRLGEMVKRT